MESDMHEYKMIITNMCDFHAFFLIHTTLDQRLLDI